LSLRSGPNQSKSPDYLFEVRSNAFSPSSAGPASEHSVLTGPKPKPWIFQQILAVSALVDISIVVDFPNATTGEMGCDVTPHTIAYLSPDAELVLCGPTWKYGSLEKKCDGDEFTFPVILNSKKAGRRFAGCFQT
jgi:hypothetical protein